MPATYQNKLSSHLLVMNEYGTAFCPFIPVTSKPALDGLPKIFVPMSRCGAVTTRAEASPQVDGVSNKWKDC